MFANLNCRNCDCIGFFIRRLKKKNVSRLLICLLFVIFIKIYIGIDRIEKVDVLAFMKNLKNNINDSFREEQIESFLRMPDNDLVPLVASANKSYEQKTTFHIDAQLVKLIPEVVFINVFCEGGSHINIDNRWNIAEAMLKSAVILTKTKLRFIFIMESESAFQRLLNFTSTWPAEYTRRLSLEYIKSWYPAEHEDIKTWYAPCATQKLFIPEMLPEDLDAGIFIDLDIIFLGPPEEMWREFTKFNKSHVMGMVPCKARYNDPNGLNRVPFYGDSGLNSGVIYMNFTRLKQFPGIGYMNETVKILVDYRKNIRLPDQDILNVLFYKHPDLLFEIGCQFNYRFSDCYFHGKNICEYAGKHGAYLLHGNAKAFTGDDEMKLRVVYEAFAEHSIDLPLSTLLHNLQKKLSMVTKKHSQCANTPDIDHILSYELSKHV